MGGGIVGSLFMLFWIGTPVSWGIDILQQGQPVGWIFVAFGSLGLGGLWDCGKVLTD